MSFVYKKYNEHILCKKFDTGTKIEKKKHSSWIIIVWLLILS